MSIRITGLTEQQVAFLDKMWTCESNEELQDFFRSLSTVDRTEALRLKELILIESIDQYVADMQHYPDSERVILDIMDK